MGGVDFLRPFAALEWPYRDCTILIGFTFCNDSASDILTEDAVSEV